VSPHISPEVVSVKILYEDDFLLAVLKPAGMVVNRSDTYNGFTLQDWIEKSNVIKIETKEKEFMSRLGLVHRLDKETSGIILIAKDANTFKALQEQFKTRTVEKTYTAIVYGIFVDVPDGGVIEIDAPIGRNPKNRERFAVVENGRTAVTEIKVIHNYFIDFSSQFALVECIPKSGRTHQIRVHLTALSHPVIGDKIYSGRVRSLKNKEMYKRQYLHAMRLKFNHPADGRRMDIKSEIPVDMQNMLDFLEKSATCDGLRSRPVATEAGNLKR